MPPYLIRHWQLLVYAAGIGLLLVVLLYLALRARRRYDREDVEDEGHEFPQGLTEGNKSIPTVLVVFYIGFVIWGVFYTAMVALYGLGYWGWNQ